MNILFLGNGYDLNYNLPTSYRNFLLTVDFLAKHNLDNINNAGDVFGNPALYNLDSFIKDSYEKYKTIYDGIVLERDTLQKIVDKTKNNIWFMYLIKSFNRDVGWIDFEKEIAFVVNCFQVFFENAKVVFHASKVCKEDSIKYIIMEVFNFFIDEKSNSLTPGYREVKQEYTVEYPLTSGNYIIDKEKIIKYLYGQLNEFTYALKIYLRSFIDTTTSVLFKDKKISRLPITESNDIVVTFNYTNTYELFYPETQVFHIHGNVNNKIILGVNSDENDVEKTVDTSFVEFKKYYQRTYYGTDIPYLRWLRDMLDGGIDSSDIQLLVMGHSLDVTDREYIYELFGVSSKITILYHNDNAKAQYIKNLINIFGGEEFERIRDEQQLEFLNINLDLTEFCEERKNNSTDEYNKRMVQCL